MKEKKYVYVVHATNCNGDSCMNVFEDELAAYHFMIGEMERVIDCLKEEGYAVDSEEDDISCEVWIPDTSIYYEWYLYEGEYHNK